MNNKSIVSLLGGSIAFVVWCGSVNAQKEIKIDAEIVAYDRFTSAIALTSAPAKQLFLVRVDKVLKGSEPEEFLLVQQQISKKRERLVSHARDGKSAIRMTLTRNQSCDSTIDSLVFVYKDVSGPKEVVSRMEWLRNDLKIASDKLIACYAIVKYRY